VKVERAELPKSNGTGTGKSTPSLKVKTEARTTTSSSGASKSRKPAKKRSASAKSEDDDDDDDAEQKDKSSHQPSNDSASYYQCGTKFKANDNTYRITYRGWDAPVSKTKIIDKKKARVEHVSTAVNVSDDSFHNFLFTNSSSQFVLIDKTLAKKIEDTFGSDSASTKTLTQLKRMQGIIERKNFQRSQKPGEENSIRMHMHPLEYKRRKQWCIKKRQEIASKALYSCNPKGIMTEFQNEFFLMDNDGTHEHLEEAHAKWKKCMDGVKKEDQTKKALEVFGDDIILAIHSYLCFTSDAVRSRVPIKSTDNNSSSSSSQQQQSDAEESGSDENEEDADEEGDDDDDDGEEDADEQEEEEEPTQRKEKRSRKQ
jgi:hypothetical protein